MSQSACARFKARLFASSALLLATGIFAGAANATDFLINSPKTETNGGISIQDGDTLTIEDAGSITTDQDNEVATQLFNRNVFQNFGIITTSGRFGHGIDVQGDGNDVTNSHLIRTTGANAQGIDVNDDGNTIANASGGAIVTSGEGAKGIGVFGDRNIITNSGAISTTGGGGAHGIQVIGNRNTVTNAGVITTTGSAQGISVVGNGNTVTNSDGAVIATTGRTGNGIIAEGGSNSITNSGIISTTGEFARGITAFDGRNTIVNSGGGIIATTGDGAFGIRVDGEANNVINNSRISTEGDAAHGIQATFLGNGNNIVNSGGGIIATRGDGAIGIRVDGGGSNIINNASISTEGVAAHGIAAVGNGNNIINSGSIRVTGAGSFAIFLEGANNTLNLQAPSFIGGEINLGTDATLNISTGRSHSVLWYFDGTLKDGAPTITGNAASFFNKDTQKFATLDTTGLAAAYDSLGDMTGQLSNVGREGLSGRLSNAYGSVYGLKDGGGDPAIAHDKSLWVTPFGSRTEHKGDETTFDRDITQAGVALGYRWQQQPDLGLGVMAGYLRDETKADSLFAKSHDSEADAFFAGANGRKQWGSLFLDFALVGGFMSHDQDRFVNDHLASRGVSFVNASYDSRFISPEAGLSMSFDVGNGLSLTPGVKVRYAAQWLDGYTEEGGRANATVDDRMLGLLEASAEIAATQRLGFGSVTGRLGILSRTSTGDDDVSVSLVDVSNTVAFGAADDVAGYVGLNASIDAADNLKLDFDGQATFGEDFTGVQGMAKIIQRF